MFLFAPVYYLIYDWAFHPRDEGFADVIKFAVVDDKADATSTPPTSDPSGIRIHDIRAKGR